MRKHVKLPLGECAAPPSSVYKYRTGSTHPITAAVEFHDAQNTKQTTEGSFQISVYCICVLLCTATHLLVTMRTSRHSRIIFLLEILQRFQWDRSAVPTGRHAKLNYHLWGGLSATHIKLFSWRSLVSFSLHTKFSGCHSVSSFFILFLKRVEFFCSVSHLEKVKQPIRVFLKYSNLQGNVNFFISLVAQPSALYSKFIYARSCYFMAVTVCLWQWESLVLIRTILCTSASSFKTFFSFSVVSCY